jgi:2-dehydropantoate 2-reductase
MEGRVRIGVIGAGAVGGYFGGKLARGGHNVVFVARGATLRAIQTQGLKVDDLEDHFASSDD